MGVLVLHTRTKIRAEVWIDPSGDGHEFPKPITFSTGYCRRYILNYAKQCRVRGQKVRIVWKDV
jgi:hypothetical protein